MMIPKHEQTMPGTGEVIQAHTVSASQLRTYGAGGFRLTEQEEARGCPRQYKAKYVEHRVAQEFSYPLVYGRTVHEVLWLMEEESIGPEEALDRCFPPELEPEAYREMLDDLTAYFERGASPTDRFGTIAIEQDLHALLYVDEDFGPVFYRGIVDWIGVDLEVPNLLRVVDYKTNRTPPSVDDVRGDVQLKGYDYLLRQNWERYMPKGSRPRIAQHLDAIKWREVEVAFSDEDIEDWHAWASAVVRRMLRDDKAEPVLNPGCAWCPVKDDCPAYLGLPSVGEAIAAQATGTDEDPAQVPLMDDVQRLAWRDSANAARLLLEKAVKAVDEEFKTRALTLGAVEVGAQEFVRETEWKDEVDMRALHRALGNDVFYRVISAGKTKIKEMTKDWDPGRTRAVWDAYRRVPVGTTVVRRKREEQ